MLFDHLILWFHWKREKCFDQPIFVKISILTLHKSPLFNNICLHEIVLSSGEIKSFFLIYILFL